MREGYSSSSSLNVDEQTKKNLDSYFSKNFSGIICQEMKLTEQIVQHFREVYFGGNWTSVNMKETLENINSHEAILSTELWHSFIILIIM
jgi:hypothetical protein